MDEEEGERKQRLVTCLPTGFNGVEVVTKVAGDDPHLRQAKFIRVADNRRPHVYVSLCTIVLIPHYIPDRML